MEVKIITDVSTEPVTLAEAKSFCRIDADYVDNDGVITAFIISARERLEKFTNLSFASKQLEVQFSNYLQIPYGPVKEIVSVKNTEGDTIDADKYRIVGLDFKTIYAGELTNAEFFYNINGSVDIWSLENYSCLYNIVYDAGYGSDTDYTPLPKSLKTAILIQVNEDYKNLGNPMLEELSSAAKMVAQPFSRNLVIQ
jgi:hypothetical protein